jgi:hypothetical protein
MGTNLAKALCSAAMFGDNIPMKSPLGRASAGNVQVIVIPVVVGSSPISHPNIHAGRSLSRC